MRRNHKNHIGSPCRPVFAFPFEMYICCSSIFAFGTIFSEPVQNFWTSTKFFEPVQKFWTSTKFFELVQFFLFLFLRQTKIKNSLDTFDLYPPSSLHLHSTYLTYYSLPALPTSQPLFFLSQCLPCEPWTTDLWFFLWIHVLMPYHWAMKTWMQVPLFF